MHSFCISFCISLLFDFFLFPFSRMVSGSFSVAAITDLPMLLFNSIIFNITLKNIFRVCG